MTQTGPAAQHDVLLPHGWNEANRADSLLFQLDGLELRLIPGSSFDEVADAVIDTAKDFAEDGDLDVSLKERAEDLKDSLQALTVKELKAQLKEKGLSLDGKKADLIERLLTAGDEQ